MRELYESTEDLLSRMIEERNKIKEEIDKLDKARQYRAWILDKKVVKNTNILAQRAGRVSRALEIKQPEERISNEEGLNKSKKFKIWKLLLNWLACDDQEIALDLEDLMEDLKSSGATKMEIFFKVLLDLLPLLPKLIFGRLPIPSKKRND